MPRARLGHGIHIVVAAHRDGQQGQAGIAHGDIDMLAFACALTGLQGQQQGDGGMGARQHIGHLQARQRRRRQAVEPG
jgi:hypothetical protein